MSSYVPPFRADTVGSLLRPPELLKARKALAAGTIDRAALAAIEDREIARVVAHQQSLGFEAVTDGEFRRDWWHFDFFEHLGGVQGYESAGGIRFQGLETPARGVHVMDRLSFERTHPMLDHFRYLDSVCDKSMAKMTIPSPSVLHFRGGIDRQVYPGMVSYFADLADTWREAVSAFYDAGCRYLQLDDTVWAYLCSEQELEAARSRGIHAPEQLKHLYAEVLEHVLADRPDDLYVSLHVCRGNFRSRWISEGGYEPVAETLFGRVPVDAFFLEYDSERAGGFEPLRFLPEGPQQAVLGLVTTKSGALESGEVIEARLREASRHVPLSRLCLSPQCGFASTCEGNELSEQQQWEKLSLIQRVARQVWG